MKQWVILGFLVLLGASALGAKDWVSIYREEGLSALEREANERLSDPLYWADRLKDFDTRYGYYEQPRKHLFIVDKGARTMRFYDYQGGKLIHEGDYNTTLGDAHGDKFVEGDLKTPVGTYTITSRLTKKHQLDPYYGPLAYTTNYPNYHDRKLGKTGHGIWLHGFPLNGGRENENSEGCVVIDNGELKAIDERIEASQMVVMINEEGMLEADDRHLAQILALLFEWRYHWKTNALEPYLALYSEDFTRHDGMARGPFDRMKRLIFSRDEPKKIRFSDIEIAPYPNSLGQVLYRVRYYQDYWAPSHQSARTKELYLRQEGDRFKIVLEH